MRIEKQGVYTEYIKEKEEVSMAKGSGGTRISRAGATASVVKGSVYDVDGGGIL